MSTRHVVICGLPRYTMFLHIISKNGTNFEEKKKKFAEHKMCVLISSQRLSETFLILKRNERDVIKYVHDLHVK